MSHAGINDATGGGGGNIQTLTGNSGGAVPPSANNINILGQTGEISVTGNPGTSTLTISLVGGSEAMDSFQPDSGTNPVVPDGTGLVVMSGTGSVTSVGGTNQLTYELTGLTNHAVLVGAGTPTITKVAPTSNLYPLVSAGVSADPAFSLLTVPGGGTGIATTTAYAPICGGTTATGAFQSASTNISSSGFVLTSNGAAALPSFQAISGLGAITTITGNTGGAESPSSGNFNIVGTGSITVAGSAATETIQLTGLNNNAVLVGAGSATITNVGPTNNAVFTSSAAGVPTWTSLASNGQVIIGSGSGAPTAATLTAGTNVTITNAANSITIASGTTSQVVSYTSVNHAASPYAAASTDYYLGVDCSAGVVTVQLPNAPTTGRIFVVKDKTNNAGTNNITVTTVGGAVNIDGATSYVISVSNYISISLIFNGSTYEVY